MKPPVARRAQPREWKDRIPRQGRDPGDYPSVFDELDDATRDNNVSDGPAARRGAVQMKAGGKVTKVTGPKRGKEDGLIAVQKGEFVVKKSVTRKQGDRKMAALNAGKAKVVPKRGKR